MVMEPVCSNTVALVTLSRHAMPLLLSHKTAVFHVALLPGDDTGVAALGSRPGLWWLMAMNCSDNRVPISVSSTRSKGKQGITVGADLATGCAERKAICAP